MIRTILFLFSITLCFSVSAQTSKSGEEVKINASGIVDIMVPAQSAKGKPVITRWNSLGTVAHTTTVKGSKSNTDDRVLSSNLSIKVLNSKNIPVGGWSVTEANGVSILDLTHIANGSYTLKAIKSAREYAEKAINVASGLIHG